MSCARCGTPNEPGRKFCGECGAPLALSCPSCGTSNAPSSKFCGECATPLTAGAAPRPAVANVGSHGPPTLPESGSVPAPAPTAERRLVSVLFVDLVGFTPFAEERDSEDVRETLTRYFELATEVVGRYGGLVEKFIGDAVMAVWGTPTVREDDAERAVRAALDLVDAVKSLGEGIAARAGVLTGEAAVTLGATNQGMVAGDIVNTASRLQSVAAPGTVLVGDSTYRAASAAIAFEPAGEQSLKGRATPVPAYWALRVIAERGGRGRSDTLEAPFVGRDDELRLIKDLYHATARESRTRLVSITGIGGIGKSRLAWELEKYLDGIVGTIWWHRGRSPAYGAGISFWALGEMVRARAGLAETDDEATTRSRIAQLLDRLGIDGRERRWVESALLTLLGIDTGVDSEQLFGAWRTFFERLAASGPVVLVFEDLHWADAGTIDFIDHLVEWSRAVPLYIVTLARPELLDRRSDWGAGRRNFTSLYLEPLSEASMRQLLAGLAPGLPESAVRSIVGRAEGVPLYAVETIRMLVAEGKLTPAPDGTYSPAGDLTTLAVPETLTALIASRLDGLDPADRNLVLDAAVLGQSFTVAGLAVVAGTAEADLEPRLRSLVRRELFAHVTDPRSPERGQYAFVQALIREVAYNTLAKKDRKLRHLAAARFFESLGTDEVAAGLAGHYLAARDNASEAAEADALGAAARVALRGAAERAASLGGHDQAVALYEQAIDVTADRSERAELSLRAGTSASLSGRHEVAIRHLRAALDARRGLDDRVAVVRTLAALGTALNTASKSVEAVPLLRPTIAEFADLADDPDYIALSGQFARALFLADENDAAIANVDSVLAAAEHADLRQIVADTLVTKGTAIAIAGRPIEGLGLIRAGQALAEAEGYHQTALRAFNNRAFAEQPRDPRSTLEGYKTALALARRLGQRTWIPQFVIAQTETAFRTGDWDVALADVDEALTDSWEPWDHAGLISSSLWIRACRGERVEDAFSQAADLLGDSQDPQQRAQLREALGVIRWAAGRTAEARSTWREALELNSSLLADVVAWQGRAAAIAGDADWIRETIDALDVAGLHGPAFTALRMTLRAGLAAIDGRVPEARTQFRVAFEAWTDLGLAWDAALCGVAMAVLLDPRDPEVATVAGSARETLVRLRAQPLIDRLDAALTAAPDQSASRATTSSSSSAPVGSNPSPR